MPRRERIPLLCDHHSHPSIYGAMRTCPDLRDVREKSTALDLLAAQTDAFVFALGWNDSLFDFTDADLAGLPPVFIVNTSLHGFRLNGAARERLAESHPEVERGIDDQDWVERNLQTVLKLIVEVKGCDADCLLAFYDTLHGQGVWSAQEMLLPGAATIDAFEAAGLTERTLVWADPQTCEALDAAHRVRVHGIKLFTDGALGAHTAAMVEPLRSGEAGILLRSDAQLRATLGEAADTGKALAVHAVGDRALEQILSALEDVGRDGVGFPEVRLEHCQFISGRNARRVKALGATLSMQPNFSIETLSYADRLTPAQCALNNPFRRLIDEDGFVPGEDLILGSDGMPHGAGFALQMALFPPLPAQRLELEEFIAAYCMPDTAPGSLEIEIDTARRAIRLPSLSAD